MVYLDDRWKEVNDSSEAYYKRSAYYDHGKFTHYLFPLKKKWTLEVPSGAEPKKGQPILLEGIYKRYNRKGKLASIEEFSNGRYISFKGYYPSGELFAYWNNTPQPDTGLPIIYPIVNYTKDGWILGHFYESRHLMGIYDRQITEYLKNPQVGDYYLVRRDESERIGGNHLSLVKVIAVEEDRVKFVYSSKMHRRPRDFYNEIAKGLSESDNNYFNQNYVVTTPISHLNSREIGIWEILRRGEAIVNR